MWNIETSMNGRYSSGTQNISLANKLLASSSQNRNPKTPKDIHPIHFITLAWRPPSIPASCNTYASITVTERSSRRRPPPRNLAEKEPKLFPVPTHTWTPNVSSQQPQHGQLHWLRRREGRPAIFRTSQGVSRQSQNRDGDGDGDRERSVGSVAPILNQPIYAQNLAPKSSFSWNMPPSENPPYS